MSTYTPILSVTLTSAQSSVSLSNIPQTYTDLVLVIQAKTTNASASRLNTQYNSDTGNNYSFTQLTGDGSTASSARIGNFSILDFGSFPSSSNSDQAQSIIHIMNYSNTTTNKTTLIRFGNASTETVARVGTYRSTSAISTISMTFQAGNIATGSTFNLYGIANASINNVAKATGGSSVYTDGSYWYHIFNSSGIFTPTQALTADYLVVAGGGAGGAAEGGAPANYSGGGGAGGLRCTVTATGGGGSLESPLSLLANTAYTVTVGAGGTASAAAWTSGSNSVFSTITSVGGGRGGGLNTTPAWIAPATGGSGGGGTEADAAGAAGTANQGRAGGTSPGGPSGNSGGGGGGAGAVGGNGTTNNGGAGGAGVATSITGASITYAGGGGGSGSSSGGGGGSGGGGAGSTGTATAGTANTGGGGGSGVRSGAAGGSGVVIVRYAV